MRPYRAFTMVAGFGAVAALSGLAPAAAAQKTLPTLRPTLTSAVRPAVSPSARPSLRPGHEDDRQAEAKTAPKPPKSSDVKATPAAVSRTGTYRIVGVGDVMIGSNFPTPILNPKLTRNVDPKAVLGARLARILKDGPRKVVFANIEGTIHNLKGPSKHCSNPRLCFVFRMPPYYARILRRVGFSLGSMANNHGGDFLLGGRKATYRALTHAGIKAAGADLPGMRTAVLKLPDGTRIGFTAFGHNPGLLRTTNYAQVKRVIRGLARRSDIVVVSFHGGAEGMTATRVPRRTEIFLGENRGNVYKFAHTAVDAGADVVFGQGPHVPRAIEVYKHRFIAYSLGNFWTYGRFNLRSTAGLAPIADVTVDGKGRLVALRIRSAHQVGRGVPRYDPSGAAMRAIARFTKRDFPHTRLTFHKDGRVTGPGIGG